MTSKPHVTVEQIELRHEHLDGPVTVFQIKLEDNTGTWFEQYTELGQVQAFLRGVAAVYGLMRDHIELPLIGRLPGGVVQVENPERQYWCKKCLKQTAQKVPDSQGWDGFCHSCGMIAQNQVLDFKPCSKCKGEKQDNRSCEECHGTGRSSS